MSALNIPILENPPTQVSTAISSYKTTKEFRKLHMTSLDAPLTASIAERTTMTVTNLEPASFATLPRELRQKILLEAVVTEINRAIATGALLATLNGFGTPSDVHIDKPIVINSLAAAHNIVVSLAAAFASSDVAADIEWAEEECFQVLKAYELRYVRSLRGRSFVKIADWIVEQGVRGVEMENCLVSPTSDLTEHSHTRPVASSGKEDVWQDLNVQLDMFLEHRSRS